MYWHVVYYISSDFVSVRWLGTIPWNPPVHSPCIYICMQARPNFWACTLLNACIVERKCFYFIQIVYVVHVCDWYVPDDSHHVFIPLPAFCHQCLQGFEWHLRPVLQLNTILTEFSCRSVSLCDRSQWPEIKLQQLQPGLFSVYEQKWAFCNMLPWL